MNIWAVLKSFLLISCLIDANFFSFLKTECIGEKDYLHATDVWIMFKIKTLGNYQDLYLKIGNLLSCF